MTSLRFLWIVAPAAATRCDREFCIVFYMTLLRELDYVAGCGHSLAAYSLVLYFT